MNRWHLFFCTLLTGLVLSASTSLVAADTLTISADTSDPAPRAAFEQVVEAFRAEHPDIDVQLTIYDHERFKPAIRLFLMFDAPDVVTWYAGNRMRFFVDRGLFEDVSDVWEAHGLKETMAASLPSMSVEGKQYGVPYTYYQWGVYYRKDIFDQHGIEVPQTWEAFLKACQTLKEAGLTPLAIGTKPLWPAAGWFDYLNLRSHGLAFHLQLTAGEVPYTDARVRQVFERWQQLVEPGYFIDDHVDLSWQDALQHVIDGQSAMTLIGNFAVPFFEQAGVVDNIDFFPFPTIDPSQARFEDAPIDTVHIPANAENKADARKFLAFIARADIQSAINRTLKQLPANNQAAISDDRFLAAGRELLNTAAGLAQFYDRDANPEMAQIGMLGMRKFMRESSRLEHILQRLEIERRRIYEIRQPPDGS